MKNYKKAFGVLSATALLFGSVAAVDAAQINGNISFFGGVNLDTSSSGTATQVTHWSGFGGVGSPIVADATGDFASFVTPGDNAIFQAPWSFNSGVVSNFWTVDGFKFDLTQSAIISQVVSPAGLIVGGTGTISGNGFDATPGVWSFTSQDPGAGTPPTFSFSASGDATPVVCSCTLTFGSPQSITNCAGETIPAVVASEDCGNGPTPVAVNFVGAVTNGSCPQIITRTNTATDDCGKVHTFVQTITINCLPDCTITPSVTIAVVGGSNYTATVANAGVGATYNWVILNGSITSGQGTTKITWAAGTDTNSPISINVGVTSPSGCSSTCSASVRLTPKPPQVGLGSGDTATIGFWHNKNGQALILSAPNQPALGNWLASNFPCMYGSLAGKSNSVVAALFLTDFGVKGQKTDAQVLAGALAAYFTSSTLAGNGAAQYGFNITPGGTGAKVFNVGSLGTTIGLQNNTSYTVLQILQAAQANCPFSSSVFNALNTIFDGINTTGDIK